MKRTQQEGNIWLNCRWISSHLVKVTLLWKPGTHTVRRLFQRKALQSVQLWCFSAIKYLPALLTYSKVCVFYVSKLPLSPSLPPPHTHIHNLSWEPCSSASTSGGSYCSQHQDRGTWRFPYHRVSTPGAHISMLSGNVDVRPACVLLGKFNDLSDHQSTHLWNGENNTCPCYFTRLS